MKSLAVFVFSALAACSLFTGCTVYTEKQSESLSRAVYATKDSIDCGRFELADSYAVESTRIVKPPKDRIEIKPIYKAGSTKNTVNENSSVNLGKIGNKIPAVIADPVRPSRTVVIPLRFGADPVTVVGTDEYEQLLKDNRLALQLKADFDNLSKLKTQVDVELQKQYEMRDKMVEELIQLQKKVVEQDLALLRKNIVIVSLVGAVCVAAYLRMKGVL